MWWSEPGAPHLGLLWRAYYRRFDVEHFARFLKQRLGWTTPRVRQPEQADRWTWLVLAACAQLLLARGVVADRRGAAGKRQLIEGVIWQLKDCFGLERHRAKTLSGLLARLAAKVTAYTCGQLLNKNLGRPLRLLADLLV